MMILVYKKPWACVSPKSDACQSFLCSDGTAPCVLYGKSALHWAEMLVSLKSGTSLSA